MSESITIRGHHLLCIQGFQGLGYDSVFVQELARLVELLKKHPDTTITLTGDTDNICISCPHQMGKNCAKDTTADLRMRKRDALVLTQAGLAIGMQRSARDFFNRVNEALQTKASVSEICGNCAWRQECLWYTSRKSP